MASGWGSLLGELTAFATVVALSPFSVIPGIALVIHSEHPKRTGPAFIAGWFAGKASLVLLFVQAPRLVDRLDQPAPHWTAWVRIVAGVLCLAAGIWYWLRPPKTVAAPRWVTGIKGVSPIGAAVAGVVITVLNLKVLLMCAAAGLAIGATRLAGLGEGLAVAYFTLLGGSTAAVPVVAYLIWSHRVDQQLERFRDWLQRRQALITTVSLVLVGIGLLYSGIDAL